MVDRVLFNSNNVLLKGNAFCSVIDHPVSVDLSSGFGFLARLAKFFLMECTLLVGLRSQFRHMQEILVYGPVSWLCS